MSYLGCQFASVSNPRCWFWPLKPFMAWHQVIWGITPPELQLLVPSDPSREVCCKSHLSRNYTGPEEMALLYPDAHYMEQSSLSPPPTWSEVISSLPYFLDIPQELALSLGLFGGGGGESQGTDEILRWLHLCVCVCAIWLCLTCLLLFCYVIQSNIFWDGQVYKFDK